MVRHDRHASPDPAFADYRVEALTFPVAASRPHG
jgi:hypothetical protein